MKQSFICVLFRIHPPQSAFQSISLRRQTFEKRDALLSQSHVRDVSRSAAETAEIARGACLILAELA